MDGLEAGITLWCFKFWWGREGERGGERGRKGRKGRVSKKSGFSIFLRCLKGADAGLGGGGGCIASLLLVRPYPGIRLRPTDLQTRPLRNDVPRSRQWDVGEWGIGTFVEWEWGLIARRSSEKRWCGEFNGGVAANIYLSGKGSFVGT